MEDSHMKKCIVCEKELVGRQTKYCSSKCKGKDTNVKHQNYQAQQKRGIERRTLLIDKLGGKCCKCGYDRNSSALAFHHTDASSKSFQIDLRQCSNRSENVLLEEAKKCILVCHNCHAEIHHPHFNTKEE
jgi:hypothetical protein